MPKFDDFDLDIKTTKAGEDIQPQVLSIKACTPGTCFATCKGESTLHTNCCIGSAVCSLYNDCR